MSRILPNILGAASLWGAIACNDATRPTAPVEQVARSASLLPQLPACGSNGTLDLGIDHFADGTWLRTDASATVGTGTATIVSDGGYEDGIAIPCRLSGEWTVEIEGRIVSGGQNYVFPDVIFKLSDESYIRAVSLPDGQWGWGLMVCQTNWPDNLAHPTAVFACTSDQYVNGPPNAQAGDILALRITVNLDSVYFHVRPTPDAGFQLARSIERPIPGLDVHRIAVLTPWDAHVEITRLEATELPREDVLRRTFVRGSRAPVTELATFNAEAGETYVLDMDDEGSQGADGSVTLNGTVVLAPRTDSDTGRRHLTLQVTLESANTLAVRLTGKKGSKLTAIITGPLPRRRCPAAIAPDRLTSGTWQASTGLVAVEDGVVVIPSGGANGDGFTIPCELPVPWEIDVTARIAAGGSNYVFPIIYAQLSNGWHVDASSVTDIGWLLQACDAFSWPATATVPLLGPDHLCTPGGWNSEVPPLVAEGGTMTLRVAVGHTSLSLFAKRPVDTDFSLIRSVPYDAAGLRMSRFAITQPWNAHVEVTAIAARHVQ